MTGPPVALGAGTPPAGLTRRALLVGGGAALGSGLVAACTGGSAPPPPPPPAPVTPTTTSSTLPGADPLSGDLSLAALAAGLENLLDTTYESALDLATGGKLHTVPPAVVTLLQTMQSHHRDHAAAWNAILTAAGRTAVTTVDPALGTSVVQPPVSTLTDLAGLIALALHVERVAAATYLDAVQHLLTTSGAIQTAAAIHPVEMGHVAAVNLLSGAYPVPDSFATTTGSRAAG